MDTMNSGKTPDGKPQEDAENANAGSGGAPMSPFSEDEIPALNTIAKWGARTLEELKAFGKRIFVHIAVFIAATTVAVVDDSLLSWGCVYVGGVCIIARGMAGTPAWLIPAGVGVLQTVILALFGIPPAQALFWGGVQSWVQRFVQKRCRMGSEWGMVLFFIPLGVYLLGHTPLSMLAGSFAGMGVIGVSIARAAERRQVLDAKAEELRKMGPLEPERIVVHRISLAAFSKKLPKLPVHVRGVAESIAVCTGNILESMANDQRDLEPGHRFLNRYFKAAHTVVDSHINLAREKVISPEIIEALAKSEETLTRLDEVFAKEHARLLQNDVADFSADLAVIDTLLKMDGR